VTAFARKQAPTFRGKWPADDRNPSRTKERRGSTIAWRPWAST